MNKARIIKILRVMLIQLIVPIEIKKKKIRTISRIITLPLSKLLNNVEALANFNY